MKRTTVKLSDEADARMRHEAELRGMTVSDFVREAIEAQLGIGKKRRVLFGGKTWHSGDGTIAERIEEILAEEAETWPS